MMKRIKIQPRNGYREIVKNQGLVFHDTPDKTGKLVPYWHESAYYEFDTDQIIEIEKATNDLWEMCLVACQHVIDNDLFHLLKIPQRVVPLIKRTWEEEPPSIYGRFDLAYDGINPPKMLEINADTPTMLLESSVIQWLWKEDVFPEADQHNSIHERLVEKWKELKKYWLARNQGDRLHFTHLADEENTEDLMNIVYLMETAQEAGLGVMSISMEDIGFDGRNDTFIDNDDLEIKQIFKLYPWEWMIAEMEAIGTVGGGNYLAHNNGKTQFIEPIWKMLLSNKGILAILWKLFPNHPNLLEAHLDGTNGMIESVKKPLLSREGANITIISKAGNVKSDGEYGEEGFVYQKFFDIPVMDGFRPIIGSWVIDGESAGFGVREADGMITDNTSIMTPHVFR